MVSGPQGRATMPLRRASHTDDVQSWAIRFNPWPRYARARHLPVSKRIIDGRACAGPCDPGDADHSTRKTRGTRTAGPLPEWRIWVIDSPLEKLTCRAT